MNLKRRPCKTLKNPLDAIYVISLSLEVVLTFWNIKYMKGFITWPRLAGQDEIQTKMYKV